MKAWRGIVLFTKHGNNKRRSPVGHKLQHNRPPRLPRIGRGLRATFPPLGPSCAGSFVRAACCSLEARRDSPQSLIFSMESPSSTYSIIKSQFSEGLATRYWGGVSLLRVLLTRQRAGPHFLCSLPLSVSSTGPAAVCWFPFEGGFRQFWTGWGCRTCLKIVYRLFLEKIRSSSRFALEGPWPGRSNQRWPHRGLGLPLWLWQKDLACPLDH